MNLTIMDMLKNSIKFFSLNNLVYIEKRYDYK